MTVLCFLLLNCKYYFKRLSRKMKICYILQCKRRFCFINNSERMINGKQNKMSCGKKSHDNNI